MSEERKPIGYDPMTGEPIYAAPQATEEAPQAETPQVEAPKPIRFDPMTGEPIYATAEAPQATEQPQPQAAPQPAYSPIPQDKPEKKKGGAVAIIMAVVVLLLAVAVVTFLGIRSGLFLSKKEKMVLATVNTFKETSQLMKDVNVTDILSSYDYSMCVELEVDGETLEMAGAQGPSTMQVYGRIPVSDFGDVDFAAELTDEALKLSIPMLCDDLFVYYYTEEADGYLIDEMGEEVVGLFNTMLKTWSSSSESKKMQEELVDVFKAEYDKIEVESVKKEKFEIDGQERNCVGYSMEITVENVETVVDEMEALYEEYYGELLEVMDLTTEDLFAEARDVIENDLEDCDLTVFVYKNQLACIRLEGVGEDMEILFLGGNRRTENIEVLSDGDTIIELTGTTKKDVEELTLTVEDEGSVSLEYDTKTGELEIIYEDDYEYDTATLEALIESDKKGCTITIEEMEFNYTYLEGSISITRGAEFEELDGDEFDVGNATLSDWEDIIMDYYGMTGFY